MMQPGMPRSASLAVVDVKGITMYNLCRYKKEFRDDIKSMNDFQPKNYRALWVIVLVSFAINIFLLALLVYARREAGGAARAAARAVADLKNQTFSTTIKLASDVPLITKLSIKDSFSVPIKTSVSVNTIVNVPVTIPIVGATVNIRVPINTIVPAEAIVEIPIDKEIQVNLVLPILEIPVLIPISGTPFYEILQKLEDWLLNFAGKSVVNPVRDAE